MSDVAPWPEVRSRIENAILATRQGLPAISNLLDAFGELLIERAVFKSELGDDRLFVVLDIEPERFQQGVPVAGKETFLISAEDLNKAAKRLLPAMKKGFPGIVNDLIALEKALDEERLDLEAAATDILEGKSENIRKTAQSADVESKVLEFAVGQFLKPFVEKRAELIGEMPEHLVWVKGYCPICGSWPSLSILRGKEGQRWLKCSFCAHEWRFMRVACPFCENEDQEQLEFLFSEERNSERVEVCHQCKRYIVSLDLRDRADEVVVEVALLGLVYLDILARQHGFEPGAITEWNVLD